MTTVFTLDSHVGTHIDAARHFFTDGESVDYIPLDRLLLREAVVLDVSHVPPGTGVTAADLEATGVRPVAGQIAVIKTLWTDRAWGKPEFWDNPSIWSPASANGWSAAAWPPWRWIASRRNLSG
jgi:arylformamidase